jgi:hypothetical protein
VARPSPFEDRTVTALNDVDQVGKFAISNKTARTSSAEAAIVTVEVVGLDIALGYPEVATPFSPLPESSGLVLAQISASQ